ncbi:MAG TPA: hypothetical protein VHR66_00670 [Gemmataceae bacterium]|jgi:hypothetical protein|nr:hypothetical protein [Gemmataceae bacterium]
MNRNVVQRGLGVAATLMLLLCPASARAGAGPNQKLREQLASLAHKIAEVVQEEGQSSIAVGEFTGPAQFTSNYGAGVHQLLIEELEATKKGIVRAESVLSVKGDYEYLQGGDLNVIEVSVTIKKNNGEKVGALSKKLMDDPVRIKDSEVIAAMTGRTMHLPPAAPQKDLNEKIKEEVKKPTFARTGSRIATTADCPFSIEILVAPKEHAPAELSGWSKVAAREATDEAGQPFVDIRRDEVYAVRVTNASKHDAAVTITIDGLDVFAFSEVRNANGRPKYGHFIVAPQQSAIIPGWHKTNDHADTFLVTEYGKGAISKVPAAARGKVGVLSVSFALAWEGDNKPADEPVSRSGSDGNETGFGPPVKVGLKETTRKIGVVRDIVSVRYTR